MDEKRSYLRVPLEIPVICERRGFSSFSANSKDISIGGMYVTSNEVLSFGEEIVIIARLPGASQDVRLPAVVRWLKPGGFGVQFWLLGALETHLLSRLMRR